MSWKILGKIEAQSLLDAFAALKRSLAQPENEFTRNSSIQCFEFTLELAWKTVKRVLSLSGEDATSARDAFRLGAKSHLIDDPKKWFTYIELRNKSSHTYKESVAKEIYGALNAFARDVDLLIANLGKLKE